MADNDRSDDPNNGFDPEELQRMMRELLGGGGGIDPNQFAQVAGLPIDPAMVQQLFSTLQNASQNPNAEGTDWEVAKKTALETSQRLDAPDSEKLDEARRAITQAFTVASLWLDNSTVMSTPADSPRQRERTEWVRDSIDTWIELAEPVAESISNALTRALTEQLPEELAGMLPGAGNMLRSVGGALFATQLGAVVGKLSGEVVSGGDIGIPLLTSRGSGGGSMLPDNLIGFADGLEVSLSEVAMYLTVRELAHARLFRHAQWLRPHVVSAVSDYARGIHIDSSHILSLSEDIDPSNPQQIQELLRSGSLIPSRTQQQESALNRLETLLALIEGWVDAVTQQATSMLPEADAIAEIVRRRRATGGPAERAFGTLVGLELRPKRLREAARMWSIVAERGSIEHRDRLWEHPDILPTSEEVNRPALLLERLGLAGETPEIVEDDFDRALQQLLDEEENHVTDTGTDSVDTGTGPTEDPGTGSTDNIEDDSDGDTNDKSH